MKQRILSFFFSVLLMLGLACFSYGLWMAWRPLGFIAGGLLLATGVFFVNYDAMRKAGRS